ncbi:het domain-containing protein [Ophiostoma piceae UAMH 11346]|uniref:Het domain-containing protein n=1 Tax=Ophiostoma piceae (strain UAMH 11346) TaxID=1262450 RepID=S3C288_OPHP1|nr:het domain-containing protein [Ophiostoma piceae UAMH 11346]
MGYRGGRTGKTSNQRGRRIELTCNQAAIDGYHYVWVDTNDINKSSNAELTEAINSMFQWYENARICYVFLEDLSVVGFETMEENLLNTRRGPRPRHEPQFLTISAIRDRFTECKWFTRGWTL